MVDVSKIDKIYTPGDAMIYVLKCDRDKYYIGKTSNLNLRIQEHFSDKGGSAWTSVHHPISMVETIECKSPSDEDRITKEYMKKYGIENVRGGSYTSVVLPEHEIMVLEKEIQTELNACYRCGRTNHFIDKCYAKTHVSGRVLNTIGKGVMKCYRCGGEGHWANRCHEKMME